MKEKFNIPNNSNCLNKNISNTILFDFILISKINFLMKNNGDEFTYKIINNLPVMNILDDETLNVTFDFKILYKNDGKVNEFAISKIFLCGISDFFKEILVNNPEIECFDFSNVEEKLSYEYNAENSLINIGEFIKSIKDFLMMLIDTRKYDYSFDYNDRVVEVFVVPDKKMYKFNVISLFLMKRIFGFKLIDFVVYNPPKKYTLDEFIELITIEYYFLNDIIKISYYIMFNSKSIIQLFKDYNGYESFAKKYDENINELILYLRSFISQPSCEVKGRKFYSDSLFDAIYDINDCSKIIYDYVYLITDPYAVKNLLTSLFDKLNQHYKDMVDVIINNFVKAVNLYYEKYVSLTNDTSEEPKKEFFGMFKKFFSNKSDDSSLFDSFSQDEDFQPDWIPNDYTEEMLKDKIDKRITIFSSESDDSFLFDFFFQDEDFLPDWIPDDFTEKMLKDKIDKRITIIESFGKDIEHFTDDDIEVSPLYVYNWLKSFREFNISLEVCVDGFKRPVINFFDIYDDKIKKTSTILDIITCYINDDHVNKYDYFINGDILITDTSLFNIHLNINYTFDIREIVIDMKLPQLREPPSDVEFVINDNQSLKLPVETDQGKSLFVKKVTKEEFPDGIIFKKFGFRRSDHTKLLPVKKLTLIGSFLPL